MTASKVGTSYLKLTIPLHVLPTYLKKKIEQLHVVTDMNMVCLQQLALWL